MDDGQDLESTLNDAIHGAIREQASEYVTKWICIVEAIDEEGAMGFWTFTSDNLMAWDTLGMLTHGVQLQQAKTISHMAAAWDIDDEAGDD